MGKYLKKFQTDKDYQAFKSDGTKMLIPNVSYIKNSKYCYFTPLNGTPSEPEQPEVVYPTIHATFNATSENMGAFLETGNMKSLKIDGNQIDVGTPVPTQGSLNVVGNDVTINTETNEAVVAPENLLNISEADFMSLKFTPTDKNISFDDYNTFVLIIEMDGVAQAMAIPMEEMTTLSMYFGMEYQSETHTFIVPQYFLTYLKMEGQISPTGLTGVFAKVNLDNGIIENLLDTTCNYYTVSGGLAGPYAFETEGTHEVEIELTDNSPTDMLFAMSCVSDIISMKNIKSIAPYTFASCVNLEEIVIPNDVTEIHCMAIADTPITEFTIPENVTYIGDYAFYNCSFLTSITIPNGVTSIGNWAFYSCNSLTSITIPGSVTSIGDYAFSDCKSLTSITILDSITSIGYETFNNCNNLTSVDLGNGVTSIGSRAFYYCSALTSITIPDSVTSIGDAAFYDCSNLASVTIGNGVTSIGYGVFYSCENLTSITIPDSVTEIGESAFSHCKSLTSIVIPDSVTSIGNYAFSTCSNLTSVDLGNGVTTIGVQAFDGCRSLTSITIPGSVTEIGESTFRDCQSLTSITIPDSVTEIGAYAFNRCESLTEITIPDSVTSIGSRVFNGCTSLTSVYCKAVTPPTGGSDMFSSNASGRKIYVPMASVDAYKATQYWSNYSSAIEGYNF